MVLRVARKINLVKQKVTFQLFIDDNTPATDVPKIVLKINPDNMVIKRKKRLNIGYTYGGFVVQHWHPEHTVITCEGLIGSFAGEEREHSTAYQRFQDLLNIYKKSGQIVDSPSASSGFQQPSPFPEVGTPGSDRQVISPEDFRKGFSRNKVSRGTQRYQFVEMGFGHERFRGVFETFDLTWSYDMPNTGKYSFTFLVFEERDVEFDLLDNILEVANLYESVKSNKLLRSL